MKRKAQPVKQRGSAVMRLLKKWTHSHQDILPVSLRGGTTKQSINTRE